MKVRLLTDRCGPDGDFEFGDVIDVPNDEGVRMIKADQAERIETTIRGGFENASKNKQRMTRS